MGESLGYSYHTPRASFIFKIRQIVSHINDVFSKFSKYIAPAVHHDRCERSVQMRLYNMHKREFVMVFIILFAALGLAIFVGLAGPPITSTVEQRITEVMPDLNQSQLATGPFVLKSPSLSTYSQQLWVIAKIIMNHNEEFFKREFLLNISLEGLAKDMKKTEVLKKNQAHSRNRTLSCDHDACSEFNILHLGYLEYTHFILTLNFQGLENIHQRAPIKDIIFYFKTYNPSFTKLEIWVRFIFLVVSFAMMSWFAHSLREYSIYVWSIEQKWLSLLLPLLLLYNDPIFPLMFLVDSWVPAFLDTVFQATFLCALLLFWLCIYHGLRQNERSFTQFYLPKLLIVGWMWLCSIVMATIQKYNELRDPLYSTAVQTNHFHNLRCFFIAGTIYILYLVFLIITAYSELRAMPYFDVRLKFVTILMFVVLCISLTITVLRFGVGALEDNFVAQLSTTYSSSAEFMAFYGLLNIYLYTSAFVYSASYRDFIDTQVLKDNPAFSMVNDSDEDVIYGSDDETRRPLNRGGNDNEESD
ncbi:Transmembrane protein [Armadillidium vulgare]|nr:Transmembrane protein [Armadillidium vulgare]